MANSINTKFRASYGLDAANEKVINVATADRTVLTDGVNVDYFIKENTIQKYDPTRSYLKDFSVLYNNRLWTAKQNIPSPAGPFNVGYWQPLREDPKWISINEGTRTLQSGDYVTVNTQEGKAVTLNLPTTPDDGDTITVKDVGGRPGFVDVLIKAPVQSILDRGVQVQQVLLTIPFAELVFVYNNSLWNLFTNIQADLGKTINATNVGETDVQAGESIIRNYNAAKEIVVRFPKNANNGDMIHFVGMDATSPALYHLIAHTYDDTTSIGTVGTTVYETRHAVNGYFVYDAANKLWTLFDSDTRTRLRVISSDTTLYPNDAVAVTGKALHNTTASTINLTLPTNIGIGDTVEINLMYLRLKQTVNIKPAAGDTILTDARYLQYPRSSEYPSSKDPWDTVPSLTYNGTSSYLPVLTLSYYEEGAGATLKKYWIVRDNNILTERVDAKDNTTRKRLGVIALADATTSLVESTATMTTDHTETAITPELLAKRRATVGQTGIARLASQAELTNQVSDSTNWLADVIVTPRTLDGKQATETMRGLAEIADDGESKGMGVNADDKRIITAKKLDARRATTTQSGIVLTVANGGVAPVTGPTVTRDTAGTLIYNFNDKANVVTPSTLREYISTEWALGAVYLATDAEVRGGTAAADAKHPIVVTPSALEKKVATDGLIGFTQVAKQDEVNAGTDYFKYVTPKTLNDRKSTESLTGIAKLATQLEFNAGTAGLISGPDKIKAYLSTPTRTAVTAASGLTQSGNLWTTTTFNIVAPTTTQRGTARLATQNEVDSGTDNTTIVTPLTLHSKKATNASEGIIQVATNAEVVAGVLGNKAVVPSTLKNAIQVDTTWQATVSTRGTVKTTENATTWQGNDTIGNTGVSLDVFSKDGLAISPYEFNKTLRNYLPLKATAVNSGLLNNLTSDQFIRRDINQTVNGALTLTQPTTATFITASNDVSVYATVSADKFNVRKTGSPVDTSPTKNAGINLYGAPQVATGRPTYGIHFSNTTGTDPNGIHGYGAGVWGTYFSQSIAFASEQRGWYFQQIFGNSVKNVGSVTTQGDVWFDGTINTDKTFRIKDNIIAEKDSGGNLIFGTPDQQLYLRTRNASDVRIQEVVGAPHYTFITTKNFITEGNKTYVRKDGDDVTGRLNVSQPITFTLPETSITAPHGTAPNATNFGSWVCNVTNATLIAGLPGYLVGILDTNNETGQPTGYYKEYQEFKGHGTLSQFGSSAANGAGTYQIWAPRPTVTTANHMASTYYLRHWNPVANKWDGWSRLYTSSNPPLHSEIGAISNNDTTFDSLKIRTWFQIDHVKMWADPVSKSVKFEWVD